MGSVEVKLLLDSVIIVDHFNGISPATEYLSVTRGQVAISVITRAEVLAGFDEVSGKLALRLLDALPTLDIGKAIADRAAQLRRDHRWKLPDAFQAALAQHYGMSLVTRNTKDFPPQSYSFVVVPYTM
ncbi:MAG: PIN domain-containing protein [Pseudomonadota bacterium]